MPKITLSGEKLAMAMAHAAERGMTFEEYVQEYVQLAQEQMKKEEIQLVYEAITEFFEIIGNNFITK